MNQLQDYLSEDDLDKLTAAQRRALREYQEDFERENGFNRELYKLNRFGNK